MVSSEVEDLGYDPYLILHPVRGFVEGEVQPNSVATTLSTTNVQSVLAYIE